MMNDEGTYRAQVMPTIVPIPMLIEDRIFPLLMMLLFVSPADVTVDSSPSVHMNQYRFDTMSAFLQAYASSGSLLRGTW